jgi:predicted dehydrogenase
MTGGALRIGLVGYGFGGRVFHAPLIAGVPGCVLAGVVTRSQARRIEVAEAYPGLPLFDSIADLAESGVDAIVVCTPAATHTAVTDDIVQRGIPVVCDKPFALDAKAARRTVELAERAGVLVTAYQNRRWDSDLLTVRRLLNAVREMVRRGWQPGEPDGPTRDQLADLVHEALVEQVPA